MTHTKLKLWGNYYQPVLLLILLLTKGWYNKLSEIRRAKIEQKEIETRRKYRLYNMPISDKHGTWCLYNTDFGELVWSESPFIKQLFGQHLCCIFLFSVNQDATDSRYCLHFDQLYSVYMTFFCKRPVVKVPKGPRRIAYIIYHVVCKTLKKNNGFDIERPCCIFIQLTPHNL